MIHTWRRWLQKLLGDRRAGSVSCRVRTRPRVRPTLEILEDRTLLSTSLPLNTTSWTSIGPAPITNGQVPGNLAVSGRIAGLAADPTNPNIIYIAAAGGGVWKTTNDGTSWAPLTDNQPTLFMGAIAVAPSNPNIIYAGTGEASNSISSYYGLGVLKSTDAGATWTLLGTSQFYRRTIAQIVVDPTNANTVYVAVADFGENGLGGNTGIWKSTDGGSTWTDTTTAITTTQPFSDVVIDPTSPQTLYAAVGNLYGSTANGVYETTNGGASWAAAGNFPNGSGDGVIRVALAKSSPQTLYASVSAPYTSNNGSPFLRMMKSTDGGATWAATTGTPPNYMGSQGWYDTTLAVDPSNASIVYCAGQAGTNSVLESPDGGATWVDISTGASGNNGPHADHHAIGFDANGKLLDGDDGGIWRLDNPTPGSIQWTDLNGNLAISQFIGIALNPTNANIAFGGTQDNGTDMFNNALGWTQAVGGDGGFIRIDPNTPTTIYQEFFGVSLERSDDGGVTFSPKTTGISGTLPDDQNPFDPSSPLSSDFYVPYVLDPSTPTRLILGTNIVNESTNRGDNWAPISTPNTNGWNTSANIDALAIALTNGNTIYASAGGNIFVTTNNGASWTQVNIPGYTDHFQSLLVDPGNSQIVYAVRDQFSSGAGGHVFRSTNGGATWTDISTSLPNLPTYTIALDPRTNPGTLYVGTDNGVFASNNLGSTWASFGSGLPNVQVRELVLNQNLNILGAGTHGRSVWEIAIPAPATHFAISAPTSATAGFGFVFTVTALDQSNNSTTGYSGTVQFSTSDIQATPPVTATMTGGIGYFAATLKTAGNQTITANDATTPSITGASGSILVIALPANHFVVTAATLPSYPNVPAAYPPSQSPAPAASFASTGAPVVFNVAAEDPFNNLSPTYAGTVGFASTDSAAVLPQGSTLTGGLGTFSATLGSAGNQFITATDVNNPTINGATAAIVTRGLVVTSFTPTPTGFVMSFNKPFNPSTVLIYTNGTIPDDIILKGTATQPIAGSALFNSPTAPTSITFVKTDVASAVGTFNPGSGLLTAGNYTVTLRSYSASTTNGFQDSLGTALDGKDQANPGTSYVYTFSVSAPPTAVGIPDFARGASNTDALFFAGFGNGNTFNLIYTNPNTSPTTGTATVTFSTIGATLQNNIQSALNALPQIGTSGVGVPNGEAVVTNPNTIATQGANVLVTFQNSYFVTATSQLLASTTPGVSIALATINAANTQAGNGIPVALSNGQNVTSGSFTLQYNPTLLNITGGLPKIAITGFSFTVTPTINNATSASAVISFSSPSKISSTTASLTLGSLLATVPFSATASYGAKQLLHFSSEQLNTTASSNIAVTNQDAVEVAAFFGDVNDTGMPFASSGVVGAMGIVAGLNPNAIQQTLPGFPLFPNLDPVIIGEVNLGGTSNITALDTNKMNQQLTVGQPTIPWLPAGLTVTAVGPDPTLSISRMSEVGSPMSTKSGADIGLPTSDFRLPTSDFRLFAVNIDTARPPGSTGMVEAVLALTYNPKIFDVSAADVNLGTVPEGGGGWQLSTEVNAQAGLIGVELFSTTPIQSTAGGSLVTIAMHLRGEPGSSDPGADLATALTLVPYVDPAGGPRVYQTSVADTQGEFVLHMQGTQWPANGGTTLDQALDSAQRPAHIQPTDRYGLIQEKAPPGFEPGMADLQSADDEPQPLT